MMASVEEVEVVVAHGERATLRVGDAFLKIDADQIRTDVEVEAMAPIISEYRKAALRAPETPAQSQRTSFGTAQAKPCCAAARTSPASLL
jgi:hypothetical protein